MVVWVVGFLDEMDSAWLAVPVPFARYCGKIGKVNERTVAMVWSKIKTS